VALSQTVTVDLGQDDATEVEEDDENLTAVWLELLYHDISYVGRVIVVQLQY
jgi:hypothetical protein